MNEYKYMRNEISDEYGILKLQDKILEIMVYIDNFCREYDIKYFLMGGSALGAMRHQGFIPWDDDLDIFMDFENYRKFMEMCELHLDTNRFYLQHENTKELPHFFSKIRMNGTTCLEESKLNSTKPIIGHQGIFIDIMCLNNAARSSFGRKIQYYAAGLLKARAVAKTGYKTNSKKKKMEIFFARILVWGPFKKMLLHMVRKHNKKQTYLYAHLFGRAKFENSFYPREDFCEQRYVPFENVELAVPSNVENYLTLRFGENYMQMPDEKTKSIYQSHATIWDTEKDYKEYIG